MMSRFLPVLILAFACGVVVTETLEERVKKLEGRVTTIEKSLSLGSASDPGEETTTKPIAVPGSVTRLSEVFHASELDLTLVSAKIQRIRLKDMFGDSKESQDPALLLTFKLTNTSERKILRYTSNMFLGSKFGVVDDFGNFIRGVSYGAGTQIDGALKDPTDINPSGTARHAEVFSVPPIKTKHIVVSVDLKTFGSSGTAKFIVTAEEMGL